MIEHVETEQGNALLQPRIDVGNDLVLVVNPGRLHLKYGPGVAEWKRAAVWHIRIESPRQRRVDVLGTEHVHTMGVCVGDRESGARRQLALEGQCRLHVVGRAYSRTYGLYRLVSQRCKRRGGGNRGEEIRIGDYKLLLNNSVVTLRGDKVG